MAQTKTSQRNARPGANREQARRGGAAASVASRASQPLTGLGGAGGRGGRSRFSIVGFIRDIRSELRKVVWPTRRETINLTAVVLALSVAVGLLLGGVDFIFQELFRLLLAWSGNGTF